VLDDSRVRRRRAERQFRRAVRCRRAGGAISLLPPAAPFYAADAGAPAPLRTAFRV